MAARDDILARIRLAEKARAGAAAPSGAGRQGLLPTAAVRSADPAALFRAKLTQAGASHETVAALADVPARISAYLRDRGLSGEIRLSDEAALGRLDWVSAGLSALAAPPAALRPQTVVSSAAAGIAETGSIALSTGADSRPAHNLLADAHIIVLPASRVVRTIEDAWARVAAAGPPRSLAFITGPSRTGDIEMTIEMGVHGATAMHVLIVGLPDEADVLGASAAVR